MIQAPREINMSNGSAFSINMVVPNAAMISAEPVITIMSKAERRLFISATHNAWLCCGPERSVGASENSNWLFDGGSTWEPLELWHLS